MCNNCCNNIAEITFGAQQQLMEVSLSLISMRPNRDREQRVTRIYIHMRTLILPLPPSVLLSPHPVLLCHGGIWGVLIPVKKTTRAERDTTHLTKAPINIQKKHYSTFHRGPVLYQNIQPMHTTVDYCVYPPANSET